MYPVRLIIQRVRTATPARSEFHRIFTTASLVNHSTGLPNVQHGKSKMFRDFVNIFGTVHSQSIFLVIFPPNSKDFQGLSYGSCNFLPKLYPWMFRIIFAWDFWPCHDTAIRGSLKRRTFRAAEQGITGHPP